MAEVHLVEVRLEDLLLGVVPLHFAGCGLLAQLAADGLVPAVDEVGMQVADELLRDRGCTPRPADDVVLDRTGDADDVDAVVLVEAVVLHRDEGLRHVLRQRLDGDDGAPLPSDLADQRAVARIDERRLRRLDDLPGLAGRLGRGRGLLGRQKPGGKRTRRRDEAENGRKPEWHWLECTPVDVARHGPPVRPFGWMSLLHLAIAQFRPRKGDLPGNLRRVGEVLAQAAALDPRPDVVQFPETALSGYFVEGAVREMAMSAADASAGVAAAYRAAAPGAPPIDVIIGFYEAFEGNLHNSVMYARRPPSSSRSSGVPAPDF